MIFLRGLIEDHIDAEGRQLIPDVVGEHGGEEREGRSLRDDLFVVGGLVIPDIGQLVVGEGLLDVVDIPGIHVVGRQADRVERADGVDQRSDGGGRNEDIVHGLPQNDGVLWRVLRNAHAFGNDQHHAEVVGRVLNLCDLVAALVIIHAEELRVFQLHAVIEDELAVVVFLGGGFCGLFVVVRSGIGLHIGGSVAGFVLFAACGKSRCQREKRQQQREEPEFHVVFSP